MITILIQVHNEEKHIKACIDSAKLLTDRIIVTDMKSTDRTADIARQAGAQVHEYPALPRYVEPAREFGVRLAQEGWVMILDADERMTNDLAREIKETVLHTNHSYFKIPRRNIFGGKKWLKHGGWWPDHQMRLIRTNAFRSWPKNIHSTPVIAGSMGFLKEPFEHHFHGNIASMVEKTVVFETIESELLHNAGRPVSTLTFFRKFLGELWRRLIRKMGFLDGGIGIIESIYQAFSKTITYLFLYEKSRKRNEKGRAL